MVLLRLFSEKTWPNYMHEFIPHIHHQPHRRLRPHKLPPTREPNTQLSQVVEHPSTTSAHLNVTPENRDANTDPALSKPHIQPHIRDASTSPHVFLTQHRGQRQPSIRMEREESSQMFKSCPEIFQNFSEFMERVAKFDELVTIGSSMLTGFQQALDFIQRPPVEKSSKLVDHIIKANESKRLSSYIDGGCKNVQDSVQCINKLHTCHMGLIDHINKGKSIMDELELLLHNAAAEVQAETENLQNLQNLQLEDIDEDPPEEFLSSCRQKPEATDYAAMMAIIYSMVKRDYNMQERIVSSLTLKSSSGEIESYCLMWSLRPYIDDEIVQKAWKLIP